VSLSADDALVIIWDFGLRPPARRGIGAYAPEGFRNDGIASGFAFGYAPTGRSINYNGPFDTEAHDRQNSLNLKSKI